MFNRKFALASLSIGVVLVSLFFIQHLVLAQQWTPPPSSPGSGTINPPLTNPLGVDLQLGGHSVTGAYNIKATNQICLGSPEVCKSAWPTGDVKNPMISDLDAGGNSIVNIVGPNTGKAGNNGGLEVLAGLNKKEYDNTIISSGLYAQTQSDSKNAYSYAVYGVSNNAYGTGVFGAAISGRAGYFFGPTEVNGEFTVTDGQRLCLGGTCLADWPAPGANYWTLGSGSSIYYNGGNVGINKTNPSAARLQVNAVNNAEGLRIVSSNFSPLNIRNTADNADIFRVDETGTLQVGALPWARLSTFPAACGAGQYVTAIGNTLTCATPAGGVSNAGTLNYHTKTDAAGNLVNSLIYDNGTNIGIGTSAPAATVKLQMNLSGNMEGIKIVTGNWSPLVFRNSTDTSDLFRIDETGTMNAGTVPWARLGSYPAACGAGQYVTAVGGTLTCSTPAGASLPAGTSGQTLRHNGTDWVANSLLYNNGTNIGINQTSPDAPLTFSGSVGQKIHLYGGAANTNAYVIGVETNGSTGILRLATGNGATDLISFRTGGYNGADKLVINPTVVDITDALYVGSSDRFQINSSGNLVKINNVTYSWPAAQGAASTYLMNNGSGTLTWSTVAGGMGGSGTANYVPKFTAGTTLGNSLIFDNGTSVGIRTASPNAASEVQINADANNEALRLVSAAAYSPLNIRNNGDTTDIFRVDQSGNATAAGSITATAFFYSSDQNLKKNIQTIQNPINIIKQLRGVTFDWKADDQPSLGFIGQEVEKVLPELVKTDAGGYKSVQYGNITALLTETVKVQQQQIETLNQKINTLIFEVNKLKNE